ncbi:hypothetical protein [Actinomyces wuliandei]|uniref:hypothetical protein n=1 Tax=Actinomyces wuliandei TaxID=2057743 RepID=UPI00111ABDA0|nr:hypothetical protein [Actinomyces wuliandei]
MTTCEGSWCDNWWGRLPAGVQEAVARLAQVGSPAGWVGLACVVLVGAVVAVRAGWAVVVASPALGRRRAGCAGRCRMRGERGQQAGPGHEGDLS